MRNLSNAELAVLIRCKMVGVEQISKEEYEDLFKTAPHYVYVSAQGTFFKYTVPDEMSEETLDRLERAEMLNALYAGNRNIEDMRVEMRNYIQQFDNRLSFIQKSINVIKDIMVAAVVLVVIGVIVSIGALH